MIKHTLTSPLLYYILFFVFCVIMAARQQLDWQENYHTKVDVTFNNGTTKTFTYEGRPDVMLNKGDLKVGGWVECSNVTTFDWKVYKNDNKSKN
ncbi:hypothetical protein MA9V2_124 [Chryseobacterium phage MA9V-2]|nr:hypothetical protein MA9V2_124 [Chryseobacterium phage MA9V-2]